MDGLKRLSILLILCGAVWAGTVVHDMTLPQGPYPVFRSFRRSDPNSWWDDVNDVYHVNGDLEATGDISAVALVLTGLLTTGGGRIAQTDRITTESVLTSAHHIVYGDTDGGAFQLDLPPGVDGTHYKIINCGSAGNDLTVDPNGTEQLYGGGAGVAQTVSDGEVINIHYETTEGWW